MSRFFGEDYGSILQPPACTDYSRDPKNSGINFVDNASGKYYKITSDMIMGNLLDKIMRDEVSISTRRFAERSFHRESGLCLRIVKGLTDDARSYVKFVARQIIAIEPKAVITAIWIGPHIVIPNIRMSYQSRLNFAAMLNERTPAVEVSSESNCPIGAIKYAIKYSLDSYGELDMVDIEIKSLRDQSIMLDHADIFRLSVDGNATAIEPTDLQINFTRVILIPEIAFVNRLIDTLSVIDGTSKADLSTIVSAAHPNQSLFYRGRLGEKTIHDDFRIYARAIYDKYAPIYGVDKPYDDWIGSADLSATVFDLIYRVQSQSAQEFETIYQEFIISKLFEMAVHSEISPTEVSELLYFSCAYYIATQYQKGLSGDSYNWYEYSTHEHKWRRVDDVKYLILQRVIPSAYAPVSYVQRICEDAYRAAGLSQKRDASAVTLTLIDGRKISSRVCQVVIDRMSKMSIALKSITARSGAAEILSTMLSRPEFFRRIDRDPHIIGVQGGILDVSGEAKFINRYHSYCITRTTNGTILDRDCEAVRWLRDQWYNYFYEREVAEWILLYWSQALDNFIKPVLMLFIIAPGSSGKTFWTELVADALNMSENEFDFGYACKINPELFSGVRSDPNAHTTAFIKLADKRHGLVSEASGKSFSTIAMKRVLSQELQSGRRLNQNETTFAINMTITYVSNFDPKIDEVDFGSRRRMRCYKPKYRYVTSPNPANPFERLADPDFNKSIRGNKLYKSAMLTLLAEAHDRLMRDYSGNIEKVPIPKVMLEETSEMLFKADYVYRFAVECLAIEESAPPMSYGDMVRKFVIWAGDRIKGRSYDEDSFLNSILGSYMVKSGEFYVFKHIEYAPRDELETDTKKRFSRYEWV